MTQKLYFLATDKQGKSDLWVTDGTTTQAVGGLGDLGVAGVSNSGLGPGNITAFGQKMIFGGEDGLNNTASNGIWITDGTAGGTTEVGGVSPGPGHSSPFINGNPSGLNPTDFVTFGSKALFFGTDAASFTGLWSTDGTVANTLELGGLQNGQIVGRGLNWNPTNFAAFNSSVLFSARDSSGGGSYIGLWITDGTSAGTVELGGLQNAAIFDSNASAFQANDFIQLGGQMLFNAPNQTGDSALWITDGTAAGTVELGGAGNAGIVGADKSTGFGSGLAQSVRFGARIFFGGPDNDGSVGLWTTDGTAAGTIEIGGLDDGGLTAFGQHPSSIGLGPTDLTVNGQQVLFNGRDAIGFQELWASDGTTTGTYEIGGQGVGGTVFNEAVNGLDPTSIVSLGNGKAVFIGRDSSNIQNSGKPTLWVTDGTFAGTQEMGGLNNLGVAQINATGFNFSQTLVGGDGLAYFVGANASGNQVLWKTDGTLGGTKIAVATDGNAPATGLNPANMALANPPAAESAFTGGGKSLNLNNIPGETVDLSGTNNVFDTVTGSNGTINLSAAQAFAIGGGLLITMSGVGSAVNLSQTNGNKDSVYGSKGAVTLTGAQANVIGAKNNITFAPGTTGDVVYLSNTNGSWDNVTGSGGKIYLTSAKANVTGGGDTIYFNGGTGDDVSLYSTNGAWDTVYATGGQIEVTQSQVSVVGGQNVINATTGSYVSLFSTVGNWDTFNGSSDQVYLTNAQASIVGGGDTITATAGSSASLYNTAGAWDLFKGSNCQVILINAQAAIAGGGNTIALDSNSSISLSGTNGKWDGVAATGNQITLSTAQAAVTGKGDTIFANGGSTVSLAGTAGVFDAVYGSSAGVILSNAQAAILGGYNTINASAGSTMSLSNTNGHGDVVNGSNDALYLTSAQAVLNGSANNVFLSGQSTLTAHGNFEALNFAAQFGTEVIGGFNATDVLHLSAIDWTSFAALQSSGNLFQSGADALIRLDANNSITLLGVQASSLTIGEFKFA